MAFLALSSLWPLAGNCKHVSGLSEYTEHLPDTNSLILSLFTRQPPVFELLIVSPRDFELLGVSPRDWSEAAGPLSAPSANDAPKYNHYDATAGHQQA
eukprot:365460-Chlamydomonas_euryale.AAC.2